MAICTRYTIIMEWTSNAWLLNNKRIHVRFCWITSHCGIEGNERVDQLAKRDPWLWQRPTGECPLYRFEATGNSYIQQLVQIKWDVVTYGKNVYLLKPTLWPSTKSQHLTRADEVVIIRLWIKHTEGTKAPHILSQGPPTTCHHCGQTLIIDHMLLEWTI